jgi:hypothetical protein
MTTKKTKVPPPAQTNPQFQSVVQAFAKNRHVSRESKKGFGSGALKVNDKIFAMMSSKGEFVVKLSKERVDELVSRGAGQRFDPGHGRVMKEWMVVTGKANWTELAAEAYQFVKGWIKQ